MSPRRREFSDGNVRLETVEQVGPFSRRRSKLVSAGFVDVVMRRQDGGASTGRRLRLLQARRRRAAAGVAAWKEDADASVVPDSIRHVVRVDPHRQLARQQSAKVALAKTGSRGGGQQERVEPLLDDAQASIRTALVRLVRKPVVVVVRAENLVEDDREAIQLVGVDDVLAAQYVADEVDGAEYFVPHSVPIF